MNFQYPTLTDIQFIWEKNTQRNIEVQCPVNDMDFTDSFQMFHTYMTLLLTLGKTQREEP